MGGRRWEVSVQLKDRRIIATGVARGIGAATLRAYVAEGAKVAALDVLDDQAEALVERLNAAGPGSASYHHCDVSDRAQTKSVIDQAVAELGGLDALVHIAGVELTGPAETIDDAHWDLMFQVNARGTLNTNQAVFPHLKARGGQIINFASSAGVRGLPGAAAYSASKGAVLGWSRTAALEWARYGITVNAIAPGMWTPMYEGHRASMSNSELAAHDEQMRYRVPLGGKLGDPDRDLAPVMVFLVTPGAHFITGQTLPIDGGMLMLT
jgi:NAD(P)-dependent dehydrogenase (short-subunit alcohol dehydrogenase family)